MTPRTAPGHFLSHAALLRAVKGHGLIAGLEPGVDGRLMCALAKQRSALPCPNITPVSMSLSTTLTSAS